jgi:hypothetical protein
MLSQAEKIFPEDVGTIIARSKILMILSRNEEAKQSLEIAIKVLCGLDCKLILCTGFDSKHHITHMPQLEAREEPRRNKVRSGLSFGHRSD